MYGLGRVRGREAVIIAVLLSRSEVSYMRHWVKGSISAVTAAAVFGILTSLAVTQGAPQAPAARPGGALVRTAGKPDFSGIWQANNTANWDLQTHERASDGGAARRDRQTPSCSRHRSSDSGTIGWVPGRSRRGGRRGDSLPAVGGGEKEGEPRTLDGPRSGDQVLPARRAARHVHAVSRFRSSRARPRS